MSTCFCTHDLKDELCRYEKAVGYKAILLCCHFKGSHLSEAKSEIIAGAVSDLHNYPRLPFQ